MRNSLLLLFFVLNSNLCFSQLGWHQCNTPASSQGRIDDLFMINTQIGYSCRSDGSILKTTDGGENWQKIAQNSTVYCRSIEFIDANRGFVGAFPNPGVTTNILRRTIDGGINWVDISSALPTKALKGICGLAVADQNTIYGGGNWYEDSGYIIKSIDAGNTWSLIDMSQYASSIIDLFFINKDTGFATGKSNLPLEEATILYTTNGGIDWKIVYQGIPYNQYCWKIQRLTPRIYFASIEDIPSTDKTRILRSLDGGITWKSIIISDSYVRIQGVGFLTPMLGWAGGANDKSFETKDGGKTWSIISSCPSMNRVFRVNDTLILASGAQVWKYKSGTLYPTVPEKSFASINCAPNPVSNVLTINVALEHDTHLSLMLCDASGRRVKVLDNTDRPRGSYQFYLDVKTLQGGIYHVVLGTHEDRLSSKIIVGN